MIEGYRRSVLLVGGLAIAAGCSSDVTSPSRIAPPASRRSASVDHPSPFHPNSVKYSDAASHPATGRSGSASIAARALLAKNGSTLIEVTTGPLDVSSTPPGNISKVQLKSINGSGDAIKTVNFNGLSAGGYWSNSTSQLGPDAPIQIQTNVGGIDPKRNDVVTVKTTVKKRPDLAVSDVANPATAAPNTAVSLSALVSELNGDVGATANCVLLVDGSQVDQAQGMWVDGGSAVSCAFTHTFSATGTYALEVRAADVVPGDWDTANNSATGSIKIVDPEVRMHWNAGAHDSHSGNSYNGTEAVNDCGYYYNTCWGRNNSVSSDYAWHSANVWFSAATQEKVPQFPVTVSFEETTDGGLITQMHGQAGTPGMQGCWNMYDNATTTQGSVCYSGNNHLTQASFTRYAGASTYYSNEVGLTWSRQPYYCYYSSWNGFYYEWYSYECGYSYSYSPYYWSYNGNSTYQNGTPFNLGSQVSVDIAITDANGLTFVAGGGFDLSELPGGYDSSNYSCMSLSDFYYYVRCGTQRDYSSERTGVGSGYGKAE